MACRLWGDGDKWGSGSLWCRQFGSSPYITELDHRLEHCAVVVAYAGNGSFTIDEIRPNIDWGRSRQQTTYDAWLDVDDVARVSVQVAYSSNGSFVIQYITPHVRVKKHQPVG